jgi:hypothetical protein
MPAERAPVLSLKIEHTMPGYRPLSSMVTGTAADTARAAETLQRGGDLSAAIELLERAVDITATEERAVPAWLCGRLATLYRRAHRLEDEVRLLERCRDSQESDEVRARFDARLYKAHALMSRRTRKDSVVLASVGRVRERESDSTRRVETPRRRAVAHR